MKCWEFDESIEKFELGVMMKPALRKSIVLASLFVLLLTTFYQVQPRIAYANTPHPYESLAPLGPITIEVDATEAPRKMLHARLTIPVKPGPLTLFYPKWIPGEHGPTGPITDLAGLKFSTEAGKTVSWRRDDVDMYAFHLEVPA